MMWWNHGGWGAGDWLAMSLMVVVLWGLLIAAVVWFVRASGMDSKTPTGGHATSADDQLAERFVRGEIDEDEFTDRRKALHAMSGHS
jgi:putative membrane protein